MGSGVFIPGGIRIPRSVAFQNRLEALAGVPLIEFVTVTYPTADGANPALGRDLLVQFRHGPYKLIFVASHANNIATDVWIHFTKNGYPKIAGSSAIIPAGNEAMLPLTDGQNAGIGAESNYSARYVKLKQPVNYFYVDYDHPSGGVDQRLTFGGTNAIEAMDFTRL